MRSLVFLALALVFGGVASSIMLIPSDNEIALLQFKDKKFADAKSMYEKGLRMATYLSLW